MTRHMKRRDFLRTSSLTMIAVAAGTALANPAPLNIDSAWYVHKRRFVDLPMPVLLTWNSAVVPQRSSYMDTR